MDKELAQEIADAYTVEYLERDLEFMDFVEFVDENYSPEDDDLQYDDIFPLVTQNISKALQDWLDD